MKTPRCAVFTVVAVPDDFDLRFSPCLASPSHPRAGQCIFHKVAPSPPLRRASSAYPPALYEEQKFRKTPRRTNVAFETHIFEST